MPPTPCLVLGELCVRLWRGTLAAGRAFFKSILAFNAPSIPSSGHSLAIFSHWILYSQQLQFIWKKSNPLPCCRRVGCAVVTRSSCCGWRRTSRRPFRSPVRWRTGRTGCGCWWTGCWSPTQTAQTSPTTPGNSSSNGVFTGEGPWFSLHWWPNLLPFVFQGLGLTYRAVVMKKKWKMKNVYFQTHRSFYIIFS